ncbi:hypothetical protein D0860_07349 [Hortaea werneckii]|uniref:Carboxypeptidase D n=1 Tax=Hortaea werneckii TaxID=91943 RepID=A0A3M7GML6_HORWE|nr:hypothetical protein D0860_07349 [Hortaea werneckii]
MAGEKACKHTFIVEHLDPELEEWQALEYKTIHQECEDSNSQFILSGLTDPANAHKRLGLPLTSLQQQGVEKMYPTPEARRKVCLLDPKGEKDICPEDGEEFDAFLFGGILGDDPPRDRTGELRSKGFVGRRLGPEQMTTDTAARVTRIVVQQGKRLDEIPYVDRPDIQLPAADGESAPNPNESVSMPFKYVKGEDGKPVMPEGMVKLLVDDMDKGIDDLL